MHGYRDENGVTRNKTIKILGYLDEFEKEFDDPIAHLKEVCEQMNEDIRAKKTPASSWNFFRTKKLM